MTFDYSDSDLPIKDVIAEIKSTLNNHNTAILSAPPGAGKSTLLPLTLLNEPWLNNKKIILLEPRRLAAKSIAYRLAELLNEPVGKTVGYRIRFDTKISSSTKLEIVTEGILTKMLQSDNALEDYGLVIFDEFHERSIHADIALVLTKECQSILRPDLKMLIMSATLNLVDLTDLLDAPLIESKGRQYPVEVSYMGLSDELLMVESTARTITKALNENEGDILAFLPGQREINDCANIIKRSTEDIAVHTLYGQLPQNVQKAAISPSRTGQRKVIIASAIAETSLTIEGITVVVDSGFGRYSKFDARTGLSGLVTRHISKDSADQRAGRAGRLGPGKCYRLWSKAQQAKLSLNRKPEILEADLTPLCLEMYHWGISDINELKWLTPPPTQTVYRSSKLLIDLKAVENNKITEHGKLIQKIPTHPRLAHMLLMAKEQGLSELATDLAAIIEEKDPLPKEAGIDINLRIEALRRYRQNTKKGGSFNRIEKIAEKYRDILSIKVDNSSYDPFDTGLLLVHAFPERIAYARPGNNAQFQLANGKIAIAGHKDDLAYEPWLAIANVADREKSGRIFLAAPLNPTDLKPFLQEVITNTWQSKNNGVVSKVELRIGSIVLKSTPNPNPDKEAIIEAISNAIKKEGKHLLNFNDSFEQFQNRIITLKKNDNSKVWPNFDTNYLLETNDKWLSPYLTNIKSTEDLKKIDLYKILINNFSFEDQKLINQLVPTSIEVPSGSKIKLDYQPNGEAPILAVRLQEVFGLTQTPTILKGKLSLLLHLLSPGYKPVQITSDLKSFWATTYFEVRKELRVKYKRHAWPESPSEHKAIRGTKRQNGL